MRALSRNTRRVTALTLAAALVIAVYLNWQYARADITPQTEDDTLMVSAEPVEAEAETAITDALPTEAEAASGVNKNYGEAQLVSVANDSGTRFFEQARLKREKAHDEAMDTLQKSRGEKGVRRTNGGRAGGSERRKRDRNAGARQGLCGLPVLFASRAGRPDRDDSG